MPQYSTQSNEHQSQTSRVCAERDCYPCQRHLGTRIRQRPGLEFHLQLFSNAVPFTYTYTTYAGYSMIEETARAWTVPHNRWSHRAKHQVAFLPIDSRIQHRTAVGRARQEVMDRAINHQGLTIRSRHGIIDSDRRVPRSDRR